MTNILTRSDHQTAVGHRLRRAIDILGIPYVDAAEKMGVSKQVLRNWMAGDSYPAPYALYRLSRSSGINFDYLFLGDWSRLPHEIARVLVAELDQALPVREDEKQASDQKDA